MNIWRNIVAFSLLSLTGCRESDERVLSKRPSFTPLAIGAEEPGDAEGLSPGILRIDINWSPEPPVDLEEEPTWLFDNPYVESPEPIKPKPKAKAKAKAPAKATPKKSTIKKAAPACKT